MVPARQSCVRRTVHGATLSRANLECARYSSHIYVSSVFRLRLPMLDVCTPAYFLERNAEYEFTFVSSCVLFGNWHVVYAILSSSAYRSTERGCVSVCLSGKCISD